MNYAKASYGESQVDGRLFVVNLEIVSEKTNRYTVYGISGTNNKVVVWHDQTELHSFIEDNISSVLGIQLLFKTNNKYSYTVDTPEGKVNALTISRATVLAPGTEEDPRVIGTLSSGITVIE